MTALLHRLGSDLLQLIAPSLCPSCDELLGPSERFYCGSCRASLDPAPFPRELFSEMAAHYPGEALALSALGSLYSFSLESPVQHLIHAVKYKGCYQLGVEMGAELGRALRMFREFDRVHLLVPVPLHRAKRRERGYNQAEAIAQGLARHFGDADICEALVRTRHTTSQTKLGAKARQMNVRGAFDTAYEKVRGLTVLLCDDVCTTGATLNACADRLLMAGARRVLAATVAADRDSPGHPMTYHDSFL